MGGSGSTRWTLHWKKVTVEGCLQLSIAELRPGRGKPLADLVGTSGSITWSSGAAVSYRVERSNYHLMLYLGYAVNGQPKAQTIRLSDTECNYGGVRYWFHCPRCFRRVAKLYALLGHFACRHCHDLTYTSTQEANRFESVKRFLGHGFRFLDSHYEAQALIEKWDARKRLTKGERRKIARALGLPLFRVRSRWYRLKTRAKQELAARKVKRNLE
jgi:hypothetical protein